MSRTTDAQAPKVLFRLLVLGMVIGANNLATALTLGALGQQRRRWRIVGVFGVFEFFVPLLGIWLGQQTADVLTASARWVGPLLLIAIGVWTIRGARKHRANENRLVERVTTWPGLMLLASLLSLDNLAVGFSLGLQGNAPLQLAATIAVFAVTFTWLGLQLGSAARRHWERRAQVAAGGLLIGVALAAVAGWL